MNMWCELEGMGTKYAVDHIRAYRGVWTAVKWSD